MDCTEHGVRRRCMVGPVIGSVAFRALRWPRDNQLCGPYMNMGTQLDQLGTTDRDMDPFLAPFVRGGRRRRGRSLFCLLSSSSTDPARQENKIHLALARKLSNSRILVQVPSQ